RAAAGLRERGLRRGRRSDRRRRRDRRRRHPRAARAPRRSRRRPRAPRRLPAPRPRRRPRPHGADRHERARSASPRPPGTLTGAGLSVLPYRLSGGPTIEPPRRTAVCELGWRGATMRKIFATGLVATAAICALPATASDAPLP